MLVRVVVPVLVLVTVLIGRVAVDLPAVADAVDHHAQDVRAQAGEDIAGAFRRRADVAGEPQGQEHAVHAGCDDARVRDDEDGRRIDDDEVELTANLLQHLLEARTG